MKNKKYQKKNKLEIGDWFFIMIIALVIMFVIKNIIKNHLLNSNYKVVDALIIDHKNPLGNNNVAGKFTYSYRFCLDNDCYINNALSDDYNIGDRVKVKYCEYYPDFNELITDKR
ncbi:hypothetical protein [uncultured Hymenobacter sp.]|uniref:hypothetical protein n=1 Tax=uncultured Hymenobacter sp. TaxID=170016 RepID=UPI0035CBEBA7